MKKLFIFAIIIFLLIPIFPKADETGKEIDVLKDMLDDLDGELTEGEMAFNGVIKTRFMEKEEITSLGDVLLERLNIVGQEIDPFILQDEVIGEFYSKMIIFEEDYSSINYDGHDIKGNQISINLNSYIDKETKVEETTLSISIIKSNDFFDNNDIIESIEKIYEDFNVEVDLTSCLMGKVEGNYINEEIKTDFNKSLKNIRGEIIEEFSGENFLSYTIYSPLIENYLTINQKKININLSMRYNEEEHYTYLWIGTPIITTGY